MALGASQLRNDHQLTPLLLASNGCKIEMVENLIKSPKYTKEQRIEALELLSGTIANAPVVYDIKKGIFLHETWYGREVSRIFTSIT